MSVTKTAYLVRHGETDWNSEDRWQGHSDPGINDIGKRQAERAAEYLSGMEFSEIYSSDLTRTLNTAGIIGKKLGISFIRELKCLRERDLGSLSGMTLSEIVREYPYLKLQNGMLGPNDLPTVERWRDYSERCWNCITGIMSQVESQALVVTHGGVIYTVRGKIMGNFDKQVIGNGEIVKITVEGSSYAYEQVL